ncbi:MAG TPA: hypothetical protein VF345_07850 [Chthoniobacterales bacterium]
MILSSERKWGAIFSALLLFPSVLAASIFTVVNNASSGPGSLAQAVEDANAHWEEGPQTVAFAIPGPGVHRIDLSNTTIPVASFITIDGYTQPGASPNTLSVGNNAVILIQLDGGGPGVISQGQLAIYGGDCIIRGLSFTGFKGPNLINPNPNYAAIRFVSIFPELNRRIRIEGNFIGLEPDGVTLRGNDFGIYTFGGNENMIGGSNPAARNIISGNGTGLSTRGLQTIVGNYFGTDASGLGQGYGNEVAINAGADFIGTGEAGAGNVITGNAIGVYAFGGNATIYGNLIGPRADGSASAGNGIGIVAEGSGTTIGGMGPGEGNVIAFNRTGISVFDQSNSILSNLFHSNSLIDTDLGGNGPTANDVGDQDSGPNNLQNFPIIASITRNSGETAVSGGLNSTANIAFTLQFFANGPASAPGQRLLGTKTGVTTNSAGDVSFEFAFPVATSPDEFITATATDPNGNTSEFFPPDGAVELANISTRGNVGAGDNILIGGIILNSSTAERSFLIRALGPSLNINGAMADPKIEVRASDGTLVGSNDNWRDSQQQQIIATGAAPTNDLEAAMVLPLPGESYTVQVSGVNGATGIGIVEIYALGTASGTSKEFRNLSTRGKVGTGDDVLIGGTIVLGSAPQRLIVRAIGPDLAAAGVPGSLQDPTLELRDAEGTLLASNDDWRSDQEQEIIASGLAPQDNRDSAVLTTLFPTSYTAIVRGKNGATGIALVEIYKLD